jgi:aerotaxis receptor
MRNEYVLSEEDFLVSQTDDKGVITFANEDFCKVAGYTLEELIGKNHNIVRHPDMPRAAFKDLWDTIKRKKIWTGYVKNSIKGGGYYWVYATVYPMDDGYMSCRRKPSRDEIEEVEKLYKTMR